jgi:hypothetical protein
MPTKQGRGSIGESIQESGALKRCAPKTNKR